MDLVVLRGLEHGMGNSTSRSKRMDLGGSWTRLPSASRARLPLAAAEMGHLQKNKGQAQG